MSKTLAPYTLTATMKLPKDKSPCISAGPATGAAGAAEQGSALQTLLAVIAALTIAALAIGSYLYFSEKPVQPTGEVEQLYVYPIHHESIVGGGSAGMVGVKQNFDQIMLLAMVKVHNPGKIPVYIHEFAAVAEFPNDDNRRSLAASSADFDRIFVAYPEMAAKKGTPLLPDTTITPGASVEGMLAFNYPLNKEQWDARQSLDVTVSFVHQADLVLKAPAPVGP